MAWRVEYDPRALKELAKLAKPERERIVDYMAGVGRLENPTSRGKGLTGNLAGLWRYRVGDWRVICDLMNDQLVILALSVAHHLKAYKAK